MKGDAKPLLKFLDGANNRYIIPVYQRNYDWKQKQCEQLFNDLVDIVVKNRKSHFFGSIVSSNAKKGGSSDYLIIDGQQRITTISILFTAIMNLLKNKKITSEDEMLAIKIEKTFLIDEFSKNERKLRLKPIKDDCIAFDTLVKNDESCFIENSNVTINYKYYCNKLLNMKISVDELYSAIEKLEIIDIFLHDDDDPQLIFESLNSTGLDLTEGDKIRNYILMGLQSDTQEDYYERYWNKIEKNTNNDVSSFIRNYLTLKMKRIPNINSVHYEFKSFFKEKIESDILVETERLLKDLLNYSEIYSRLINAKRDSKNLISSIYARLNHIDVTVSYPFFMALIERKNQNEITEDDELIVLKTIESFIFRRLMCPNYTTNALNKIFTTLDSEVIKFKNENPNFSYSEILIYVLESKTSTITFPKDNEFIDAIKTRDVYHLNAKNKQYLFDRLENGDTVEHVNVIELMESKDLTYEHIMPQTLTEQWKKDLGYNFQEIHDAKIHTLANATLTGYNSQYSNNPFIDKKTVEKGFKDSALNISKSLLDYDKWTLEEITKREQELITKMLILWPYPSTNFMPKVKENDIVTLDDDIVLTSRELLAYSFRNIEERKISEWATMFIEVVKELYRIDAGIIRKGVADETWKNYSNTKFSSGWAEIDTNVFIYKANSTNEKIRLLNRLFELYEIDKSELKFFLKPIDE